MTKFCMYNNTTEVQQNRNQSKKLKSGTDTEQFNIKILRQLLQTETYIIHDHRGYYTTSSSSSGTTASFLAKLVHHDQHRRSTNIYLKWGDKRITLKIYSFKFL